MKKIATILLCILLATALCLCIVACDNQPTRHTVTFAGEGVTTPSQTIDDGGTVMEPNDPVRSGYEFIGWFRDGATTPYDFSTPVHESFTLTAHWGDGYVPQEGLVGEGTSASPYLVDSAEDIEEMATKINSGEDGYADAVYRLMVDIDLSLESFTPIGSSEANRFTGEFDGNGHRIYGITIKQDVRAQGEFGFGFFGFTKMAVISDLTLEYNFSLGSASPSATIYAGGVVGYAVNTNFTHVTTKGTIDTYFMEGNSVFLGGLAGVLQMSSVDGVRYISYIENCFADFTTTIVDENSMYGGGSLESAANGGLFGYVSTALGTGGAVAIVNSATAGSVYGGEWIGGIVGQMSTNVSIIDCLSSATVQPTSNTVSYSGGLVGMSSGDGIIMDSVFTGVVNGKQGTSTSYNSCVGAIVGYAEEDDYEWYFTAGTSVVNCYNAGSRRNNGITGKNVNTSGDPASFNDSLLFTTLNWARESWTVSGESATPTAIKRSDLANSYTVTFVSKGSTHHTKTYEVNNSYNIVGQLDALSNDAPDVFWDWELAEGIGYRYYMPVVKPITLKAHWQDVSDIVGVYNGTSTFHESSSAGTIIINANGTLEWTSTTLSFGTYRFDGEHFMASIGSVGDISGTFTIKVGRPISFTFEEDVGMSGTVTYDFVKSDQDITLLGEYLSPSGDIFTFSGDGTVTFQSHKLNSGNSVRGEYTEDGNTLTFTGGRLLEQFASITATINEDGSITVTAVAKQGGYGFSATRFAKIFDADYSDKGFVGEYNITYLTASSGYVYSNLQHITLNANGSGVFSTPYSSTNIRYYFIEIEGEKYIKYIKDGNVSTFFWDSGLGIFWGKDSRGDSAYSYVVLAPVSQGNMYGASTLDRSVLVFFTETNKYVIQDNEFLRNAQIEGEFKNGARITIDGQGYYLELDNMNDYNKYCTLYPVGNEEGKYSYNGREFTLDGIGNIVEDGNVSGFYSVFADKRVVVVFDDDTLFSFTYTEAQQAGGTVTPLQTENDYFGVWYSEGKFNPLDDEGYTNKDVVIQDSKYYKLILDGFGNAAFYYHKNGEVYTPNWSNQWGTYYETSTGIHAQFNEVQPADIVFYYNMNVAYSTKFGYLGEKTFAKAGYEGPQTPPVIPDSWAGRYTGQESGGTQAQVILNLRADCTGDFKGAPFVAVYDGNKTLRFTLGGVNYTVVFDSNVTISYGTERVTLTKDGVTTDLFPASFEGTWVCTTVTGMGGTSTHTFVIQKVGSIAFDNTIPLSNIVYNYNSLTITASGGGYEFVFRYNSDDETFTIEWHDDESRSWSGVFTKSE